MRALDERRDIALDHSVRNPSTLYTHSARTDHLEALAIETATGDVNASPTDTKWSDTSLIRRNPRLV